MYAKKANLNMTATEMRLNEAGEGGGALYVAESSVSMERCKLNRNSDATIGGGALYLYGKEVRVLISSCIISRERCWYSLFAALNHQIQNAPTVVRCVDTSFGGNTAPSGTAADVAFEGSNQLVTKQRCENGKVDDINGLQVDDGGTYFSYSCPSEVLDPSPAPTTLPTVAPTMDPTRIPTPRPSSFPTTRPSPQPTLEPTPSRKYVTVSNQSQLQDAIADYGGCFCSTLFCHHTAFCSRLCFITRSSLNYERLQSGDNVSKLQST